MVNLNRNYTNKLSGALNSCLTSHRQADIMELLRKVSSTLLYSVLEMDLTVNLHRIWGRGHLIEHGDTISKIQH